MATKPNAVPTHILLLTAFLAFGGFFVAVYQVPELAARGEYADPGFSACLLVAGVAAVVAAGGVWRRVPWIAVPLLVWVGALALPMLWNAQGADRRLAVLLTAVLAAVAWYLYRWTVRARAAASAAPAPGNGASAAAPALHPSWRVLSLFALIPLAVVGPVAIALAALLTRPEPWQVGKLDSLLLLPFAQIAFVVGGTGLARTGRAGAIFALLASIVALLVTALAFLGSMAP